MGVMYECTNIMSKCHEVYTKYEEVEPGYIK